MPPKVNRVSTNDEKVTSLFVMVQGLPGTGKSTIGFSADAPYVLDFDHGFGRAHNRKRPDVVGWKSIRDWRELRSAEVKEGIDACDTIVIDTIGRATQSAMSDVIREDRNLARGEDNLTQQGWGALKKKMIRWLNDFRLTGKDLVLLGHTEEKSKKIGKEEVTEVRLVTEGGTKNEVNMMCDMVGHVLYDDDNSQRRTLVWDGVSGRWGKNPGSIPPTPVPEIVDMGDFLGDMIYRTRVAINLEADKVAALIAENSKDADTPEDMLELEERARGTSLDELNELGAELYAARHLMRDRDFKARIRVLAARAREMGWVRNTKLMRYEEAGATVDEPESAVMHEGEGVLV